MNHHILGHSDTISSYPSVLSVQTRILIESTANTMLVSDDTHLLILLYHAPIDLSHEIYFQTEAKVGIHKIPDGTYKAHKADFK